MKIHKQNGFSVVEVFMAVLIVGLVVFSGWLVWDRHHKKTSSSQVASTNTAPSTTEDKVANYTECVKASGSKTSTPAGDYWPTCTTRAGVSFIPLDPSNFSKVGEKISLDFPDPTLPCDGLPDNAKTTATLNALADDWGSVTWQANCGDSLTAIYQKTATGWTKIVGGHLPAYKCSDVTKYKIPKSIVAKCYNTDNLDQPSDNPNQ